MGRNLYIDIQNRRLVASSLSNSPVARPPAFTLADGEDLNIYLMLPTGSNAPAFTFYPIPEGATFKLGAKPKDDFETTVYLAFTDDFDLIENGIHCKLSMNTAEMLDEFETADDFHDFNFELQMTPLGELPITHCRWLQIVKNQVIDDALPPDLPPDDYYTKGEVLALKQGGNSHFEKFGKAIAIPAGSTSLDVTFTGGDIQDGAGNPTTAWHFEGHPIVRSTGNDPARPPISPIIIQMRSDGFKLAFGGIPEASDYVLDYQCVRDPA